MVQFSTTCVMQTRGRRENKYYCLFTKCISSLTQFKSPQIFNACFNVLLIKTMESTTEYETLNTLSIWNRDNVTDETKLKQCCKLYLTCSSVLIENAALRIILKSNIESVLDYVADENFHCSNQVYDFLLQMNQSLDSSAQQNPKVDRWQDELFRTNLNKFDYCHFHDYSAKFKVMSMERFQLALNPYNELDAGCCLDNLMKHSRCGLISFLNYLTQEVQDQNQQSSFIWNRSHKIMALSLHKSYDFSGAKVESTLSNNFDVTLVQKLIECLLLSLQKTKEVSQLSSRYGTILKLMTTINEDATDSDVLKLFIDDDVLLIDVTFYLLNIFVIVDQSKTHMIFNALLEIVYYDVSILIDWLCSEETATPFLRLLLRYLKLSNINLELEQRAKSVLVELNSKIVSFTTKKLFPYDAKPLVKLLSMIK